MMRSLAFKWVATLLLTSLIGVVLVGLFAYRATTTEFDRLRADQAEATFIADMTAYYQVNGSWNGLLDTLALVPAQRSNVEAFPPMNFFALADVNGVIIFGRGKFEPNRLVNATDLASGTPIIVDGDRVGTALMALPPPDLDPREQRYVEGTNRALVIGAVGASIAALLVGLLLSRSFLRQLAELNHAIAAIRAGNLQQKVSIYSRDELGDLAAAFNQMSSDLHRANDLRKQMTADIAHELRAPLAVVAGYVEGLTDGTFKPTMDRFEAIEDEVVLLRRLVEDLRTLSIADAGELKLVKQAVQPRELLDNAARAFATIAEKQQVTLRIQAEDDLPDVMLDRERMIQVLSNLIANALRYSQVGGLVTLRAARDLNKIQLSVQDTGTGIAPEHLPNIFERFYRADASRSTEDGASGLGLAIAKSIVEAHGGTIAADSIVGSGTTLTITLPIT
jgi:signal transduction histidine kinase